MTPRPMLFEIQSVDASIARIRVHNPPGHTYPGPWQNVSQTTLAEFVDFLRVAGKRLVAPPRPLVKGGALSNDRARRIIDACGLSPARASRSSDHVYRLGRLAEARGELRLAADLLTLSTALNERRHALIQYRLSDGRGNDAYADHAREVQALLGRIGGGA